MKLTKEKLIKRLIKGGYDEVGAIELAEKHFDYIVRVYEEVTVKEAANIAATLG